jgi:hypothetical protein
MSLLAGWLAALRSLNQALLAVLRAEFEALVEDLQASGRRLLAGLAWLALAAALAFCVLAVAVVAAVAALALVLPVWGAALVVAGSLLLLAVAAALAGRRQLRRVEGPAQTVSRRVHDHFDWWQQRVAPGESPAGGDRLAPLLEDEEDLP